MPRPDPAALLDDVVALARRAGEAILEVYGRDDFDVQEKSDASPLTAADLASHRVIVDGLRELTPDVPVLSEESAAVPVAERRAWERFWLVDPLDGTKEFVKRNGEFTVNIALIEGDAPVLGVVHVPAEGVTYLAAEGSGARKVAGGGEPEPIGAAPVPPGGEELVVAVSRSHAGPETARLLERLGEDFAVAYASRGSALKLCLVAEGAAHLYPRLGPTSEWDVAAAQCVAELAGARVVDLDGARFRYNKDSLLNPSFLVCTGDPARWLAYLDGPPSPAPIPPQENR